MTDSGKKAFNDAVKALSLRSMSRQMLLDKLAAKGHSEADSAVAADRMQEMHALNDLQYAETFVRERVAKGYGRIRIRRELQQRGIAEDLIEAALSETGGSEEAIERLIGVKTRGKPLDERQKQKLIGAAMRKGFSWGEIRPVLEKYLEEN